MRAIYTSSSSDRIWDDKQRFCVRELTTAKLRKPEEEGDDNHRRPKRRHTFGYYQAFRTSLEHSKEVKIVNEYAYFEHRWYCFTDYFEILHPGIQAKVSVHVVVYG